MQIENDYDKEVYNGDIGYVSDVDPEASELMVSFDGRSVTYAFGELDTLAMRLSLKSGRASALRARYGFRRLCPLLLQARSARRQRRKLRIMTR